MTSSTTDRPRTDHPPGAPAATAAAPDRLTRFAERAGGLIPDALSTSIGLLVLVFGIALLMGNSFGAAMTFPLLTALAAAVVSIFVPSSGGQWVIQGFITARTAAAVGVTAQRGLLALSVGDHVGNLLSPFWVVIAAGVARIDFRRIIGYNVLFAILWFVLGVLAFTFLPA